MHQTPPNGTITPIPIHLPVSVSSSRPIPLFLLSSSAPSHRKPALPENKHQSVERDKAEGGGLVKGEQRRMFMSFLWPSGCCRPLCRPS
ncbi:hypothetical protein CesoFtcFv8_021818 [Champsocephalus esox]|uniref:Uncharacterized protein n=2 Tax=Champsocephalus TaxID=52236 RepID=A0AAN8CLC6_CHAGU|nr:hypothetical protein CesoFtcFv8_021818 [Champsocephalus esox]KAK5905705.1 hypothetical protein CgunFtcFv8_001636 [Champsocephalus gunnari]